MEMPTLGGSRERYVVTWKAELLPRKSQRLQLAVTRGIRAHHRVRVGSFQGAAATRPIEPRGGGHEVGEPESEDGTFPPSFRRLVTFVHMRGRGLVLGRTIFGRGAICISVGVRVNFFSVGGAVLCDGLAHGVAEMAGDRAGSVKARMDATALQIGRARDLVGRGQAAQKRIEDVASQIY